MLCTGLATLLMETVKKKWNRNDESTEVLFFCFETTRVSYSCMQIDISDYSSTHSKRWVFIPLSRLCLFTWQIDVIVLMSRTQIHFPDNFKQTTATSTQRIQTNVSYLLIAKPIKPQKRLDGSRLCPCSSRPLENKNWR